MSSTDRTHTRQLGFFDPAKNAHAHVTFVGVGGIGSFAAFAAAKMGVPKLTLIDPDVVEPHNQPTQMYSTHHIGDDKVMALADQIAWHTLPQPEITTIPAKLEDTGPMSGVIVSGLDSMEARSALWQKLKLNPNVKLLLDARIDGEKIVLYACKPWDLDDIEGYEKTLYSDEEAEEGICTARNIIDVGFTVGALITRALRLHFAEQEIPKMTYQNQKTLTIMKGEWTP